MRKLLQLGQLANFGSTCEFTLGLTRIPIGALNLAHGLGRPGAIRARQCSALITRIYDDAVGGQAQLDECGCCC
jgi:hypothetical protein